MLQVTQDILLPDGTIDYKMLRAVLDYHNREKTSLQVFKNYYDGLHKITEGEEDTTKPDNRLVNNYPEYIVTLNQGYFMGKPVTYKIKDKELSELISEIYRYNDEQDENSQLAKLIGIFGKGYEIVYLDEDKKIRFNEISPLECIVAYDTKLNPEPMFAVRQYEIQDLISKKNVLYVEVYTKDNAYYLKQSGKDFEIVDTVELFFNAVPVIEFINNDERKSDFASVISLIDAYNQATSDKQNDLDYFSDAYLCLVGMDATTAEETATMRKDRILLLKNEGEAYFLIKNSNDAESEHQKDRLNADIHKFAGVPDLSDEQFAGNSSGVAMAYKLFGTEQKAVEKERKFKTALMRRLELICTVLNIKSKDKYNYTDIEISFTRNVPVDDFQAVQVATMLKGIVSTETAIGFLPMVQDLQAELDRIEKEKENYVDLDKVSDTTPENPIIENQNNDENPKQTDNE